MSLESLCAFTIKPISQLLPMWELMVKNLPQVQEMQETWVWSLGRENPLVREMATHSSTLAWKFWDRWACGLKSMGSESWTELSMHIHKHTPDARWVGNHAEPCGHPEQGSPSVSPISFFQVIDSGLYDLPWVLKNIWISSNEMDETGAHYTEWSKPER